MGERTKKEEEEEAVRSYCRKMFLSVRHKQQQLRRPEHGGTKEKKTRGGGGGRRGEGKRPSDMEERNLPSPPESSSGPKPRPSPGVICQGPEVQPVPLQLISMLRIRTLKDDLRRAAEVEIHDPSACSMCEQEQASVALRNFIWRKKTQLQMQKLRGRLNTHSEMMLPGPICTEIS